VTREVNVSHEEKTRKGSGAPFQDRSFMKEFQRMLERGDVDCAERMRRMRAMCCGEPEESEETAERKEV
jgi:hypothetical protein